MGRKGIIQVGKKFGDWTVLRRGKAPQTWVCQCSCGNARAIPNGNLTSGKSTSCGCKKGAKITAAKIRHGHNRAGMATPEYRTWAGVKRRCLNPHDRAYKAYGGSGITICKAWADSFAQFLQDMGAKPSPKHTIDRIDNNKGYEQGNCRWATPEQQWNNTSRNVWLEYQGQRKTVRQWATHLGITYQTLYRRIEMGWSVQRAFEQRVRDCGR